MDTDWRKTPVSAAGLPNLSVELLTAEGIATLGEVADLSVGRLTSIEGFGRASMKAIERALERAMLGKPPELTIGEIIMERIKAAAESVGSSGNGIAAGAVG